MERADFLKMTTVFGLGLSVLPMEALGQMQFDYYKISMPEPFYHGRHGIQQLENKLNGEICSSGMEFYKKDVYENSFGQSELTRVEMKWYDHNLAFTQHNDVLEMCNDGKSSSVSADENQLDWIKDSNGSIKIVPLESFVKQDLDLYPYSFIMPISGEVYVDKKRVSANEGVLYRIGKHSKIWSESDQFVAVFES